MSLVETDAPRSNEQGLVRDIEATEARLVSLLGRRWVRRQPRDLLAYAYDGTGERYLPDVVVFPGAAEQVRACVRVAAEAGIPVVPRGAATNLSGGTLPVRGGMVVNMLRMNRVLTVDPYARLAVVEAGVTNEALQRAVAPHGLFYAPDPSSMRVATLGGSLAENAGGPRCAKYGVTINHVLGLRVVLADGSEVEVGGGLHEPPGLDVVGVIVGSEGTLGIITEAVVRLTPLPESYRTLLAVFGSLPEATAAVSAFVAERIVPATLELMDRNTLEVVNASRESSFPADAEAVLLIEVDGVTDEVEAQAERVKQVLEAARALEISVAAGAMERDRLWAARRAGYGALARSSPSLSAMDVTVPRDHLVPMLDEVLRLSQEHRLKVFVTAHAGDGNMHPTVPYNPSDADQVRRLHLLTDGITRACVALGGSISGEHGIGIEKLPGMALQYSEEALDLMRVVKRAFDPAQRMNPGKNIPAPVGGW